MREIFGLDDFCHFLGGGKAVVIDTDDGNDPGDVFDKLLIMPIEILEVFERDAGFDVSVSHLDAFHGAFRFDIEIDDDIGLAHEIAHVAEELDVSPVIAFFHEAGFCEHRGEDGVLIDGSVLDGRLPSPDDFLMLLETPREEIDLHVEGIFCGIAVEIFEILVVFNGFIVGFDAEMVCQRSCECRFSSADHAGDANEKILHVEQPVELGRFGREMKKALGRPKTGRTCTTLTEKLKVRRFFGGRMAYRVYSQERIGETVFSQYTARGIA